MEKNYRDTNIIEGNDSERNIGEGKLINSRDKKKKNNNLLLKTIILLLCIVIWIGIVYFGVKYSKNYIDESLINIEMRNIENNQLLVKQNIEFNAEIDELNNEISNLRADVTKLNDEIVLFADEVISLKTGIDKIDTTVSSSVEIQAEVGARIQQLDNKLNELKNAMNKILEVPNE